MRARAAAALALLALVVLAGCGDSGPPRMSKAAYQRQGSEICTAYLARIRKLGTPAQFTEISPYIVKALPILSDTVTRLGALRPPEDLDEDFDRYLESMRAARKRVVDLRNAAARADGPAVEGLLADAARAGAQTDALARKAGLEACVQS